MDEIKKQDPGSVDAGGQQGGISLAEAESGIIRSAAGSMIEIGYYLKQIRDRSLYEEKGYRNIWEYAESEFGFHKSTTSRYMARNDRFSKNGNSPELDEQYQGYSKSQLQEMLTMDDNQIEQVTPDMTLREIRQIKKPSGEIPYYPIPGQMTIEDFLPEDDPGEADPEEPKCEPEIDPPGSMEITAADFFTEESVAAPQPEEGCIHRLGFPCRLSEEEKRSPGTGSDCVHHCCWECLEHNKCNIECYVSANRPEGKEQAREESVEDPEEEAMGQQDSEYDRRILQEMIQEEQETMEIMGDYWKENLQKTYLEHRMKINAYQLLLKTHDEMEVEEDG